MNDNLRRRSLVGPIVESNILGLGLVFRKQLNGGKPNQVFGGHDLQKPRQISATVERQLILSSNQALQVRERRQVALGELAAQAAEPCRQWWRGRAGHGLEARAQRQA